MGLTLDDVYPAPKGHGCVVDDTTKLALAVPISALVFNVFIVAALVWLCYHRRDVFKITQNSLVCAP